jgi:hypothetical protein
LQQQPPPGGPPGQPGAPPAPPSPLGAAQQQIEAQLQQLQGQMLAVKQQPSIEQVLTFLHDNRARTFTLDIETNSTIMLDEKAEKEGRAEFAQVLSTTLQQLGQLIAAEPRTADFCGKYLKFIVAPFRAGRELDGAIDGLVEQMEVKANAPKGDDPTTATNKTALQIEQLKQDRAKEKDQADTQIKVQELALRDKHETMKIQSNEKLKLMELQSKRGDDAAKVEQINAKAMAEREAHQMDMIGRQADMQADARKMAMQEAAAQAKQADLAARANERAAAQQFRATQQGNPAL